MIFRTLRLMAACAAAASAAGHAAELPAAAPAVQEVSRFAGEARIGGEAPLPVHLELRRSGEESSGTVTTHSGTYRVEQGRGWPDLRAVLSAEEASGTLSLRFKGDRAEGAFELGGQAGTLRLHATAADAAAFLAPPEQKADLSPAQWNADLDRLVSILTRRHGSPFHLTSRERFFEEVERVRAALPRLSGPQVALEFRRLGALIGDGHTSVGLLRSRPRIPLRTYWFDDGLRVVGIAEGHSDLLGARLVAIDGRPVEEVTQQVRAFVGHETEWSYRAAVPWLMEYADVLEAAGAGSGLVRTLTLETAEGARELRLEARTGSVKREGLGDGPLWLRNRDEAFHRERWADGTVYVNWRSYDGLSRNVAALMRDLDRNPPRRLIIDLRDNSGGDFNRGRAFIAEIARRPALNRKGRLFVLTGRTTFSAAMTNTVDVMEGTEAVLVGEPVGAAPNNWQEGRQETLPNSGLTVSFSTRYYQFLPGADAVRPHVHIPPTLADWTSPRDAAVQYILDLP